ncbi:diacylglycerol/lipid kinase family protein [Paenibacillus bovis]|uniref:Lipid kinase n=1 Tax=Paenibacillus bovis TaxID=1616788 RepID=A0A172ZBN6_9BACL|nr:YegS/Rv2252/BmrU family lipid kinase [Paenibacillus bovis]ANF94677.1 lipid kinase [Paenibacillus bovis]
MYTKGLFIYNGNAGSVDSTQVGDVLGILSAELPELNVRRTSEPGEAERICREEAEQYDVLYILGGDGTVHECVNGLAALESPPVIGVLPGGTCNDFSRTLWMPQQLPRAAEVLNERRTRTLDIGTANGHYFTNFYGIGLISETSQNINSDIKGTFGKLGYFLSTLQTVRTAEPFQFEMSHDGGEISGEAVMIYAANGRYLGTNPLPFHDESLEDGLLDVLIIREAGLPLLRELLSRKTPGQWSPESSTIEYIQTSRLTIRTERPMPADTDGEIYLETPAELGVLPGKLTFLVGEQPVATL